MTKTDENERSRIHAIARGTRELADRMLETGERCKAAGYDDLAVELFASALALSKAADRLEGQA